MIPIVSGNTQRMSKTSTTASVIKLINYFWQLLIQLMVANERSSKKISLYPSKTSLLKWAKIQVMSVSVNWNLLMMTKLLRKSSLRQGRKKRNLPREQPTTPLLPTNLKIYHRRNLRWRGGALERGEGRGERREGRGEMADMRWGRGDLRGDPDPNPNPNTNTDPNPNPNQGVLQDRAVFE